MRTFVIFFLLSAILMTRGGQWAQRWQAKQTEWQVAAAVERTQAAKREFLRANSDNDTALAAYDDATPEEREETLIDAGLLTDKTALCLRDPGALAEAPRGHTPAEMERVLYRARVQAGEMIVAMR